MPSGQAAGGAKPLGIGRCGARKGKKSWERAKPNGQKDKRDEGTQANSSLGLGCEAASKEKLKGRENDGSTKGRRN